MIFRNQSILFATVLEWIEISNFAPVLGREVWLLRGQYHLLTLEMGRIKTSNSKWEVNLCLHIVLGAIWSASDGYSWLGFDALVPLCPRLSHSNYKVPFNVRVGFLSCLPNWNLLLWWWGGDWCGWKGPTCTCTSTSTSKIDPDLTRFSASPPVPN